MNKVLLCLAIFFVSGECFPQANEAESAPEPSPSSDATVDEAVDRIFKGAKTVLSQMESAGLPEISTSNDMNKMNDLSKQYTKHAVDAFSDLMSKINNDEQLETLKKVGQFSRKLFFETFDFVNKLSDPAGGLMKDVSKVVNY